jgi:hypothetical protein
MLAKSVVHSDSNHQKNRVETCYIRCSQSVDNTAAVHGTNEEVSLCSRRGAKGSVLRNAFTLSHDQLGGEIAIMYQPPKRKRRTRENTRFSLSRALIFSSVRV